MRKTLFALSVLVVIAMLAACGPKPTAAPATVAPAPATSAPAPATSAPVPATEAPAAALPAEVTVAIGFDPGDLSPFSGLSMGRIAVLKNFYEYLVEADSMGADAVPLLAKSVEKTADKTYVVTIFDNISDSAGNHLTAADVDYSYNMGIKEGKYRPLGDLVSVKATGDYTVEFVTKGEPGVGDLDKLLSECPVVTQKAYEASPDKMATKPIATGAYVVTNYVPGSVLTLEANPKYWQTDPKLRTLFSTQNVQKINFQIITEPAQHAIALETGTADISAAVTGDDISRFENNDKFTVFKFLDNITRVINFNGSEGNPFTKKELRQAVAYAIDKAAMCQAVAPGSCKPAHTIGNANFGKYQAAWDTQPYYDFDLAKAKELLAAAGYKPGDLTVKLLSENDHTSGLMDQVIQADLKELGITVNIEQEENSVFNSMQYDPKAADMILAGSAGGDFAISPWILIYDQNRNNGTTSSFFKDDKMQELLVKVSSLDGFTPENLNAFNDYQKEQVYAYGLLSFMNNVVSVKGITALVRDTRGQLMPGAFTYAADFK
jgi:ABC-type transport system substrate-binding protein